MRRLKKKIYWGLCATTFVALAAVRHTFPSVMKEKAGTEVKDSVAIVVKTDSLTKEETQAKQETLAKPETPQKQKPKKQTETKAKQKPVVVQAPVKKGKTPHRIRGVHDYASCFPDVQDVQIVSARKWGVRPVANRQQAEQRKQELVFVGSNPYFVMDKGMSHSIPYLVPRAADLLEQIGRNFLDSLYVKDVPFHRIIVTSVLRSEADVERLKRTNPNVSPESCHRYGTTFDIAYNRYNTVCPPGEFRREVRNDSLKYVLSEVLRDLRADGRCYVKYEVKQGCFHITTR